MRTLCGCVVACSVLLSSFLGSAAWSQSGTSEPPGLDEIIAAGVCSKYPSKDYVAFRSGQYTYDLYIGDISLAGAFSGTQLLHVVYDSASSYNNGPYLRYNTEDLGLTPGTSLVYSNLGDYPALPIQGVPYEKALIFGGVVIFLFLLFRWVFSRSR